MKSLLKEYIQIILLEKMDFSMSRKQLEKSLFDAAHMLDASVTHVVYKDSHYRIYLGEFDAKDNVYKEMLAINIVEKVFREKVVIRNIGKVHSGTYDTYQAMLSDGSIINIIFAGKKSQRAGGYTYEKEIQSRLPVLQTKTDISKTDIFVQARRGEETEKIGIEVKKFDAKWGQPTLRYSYASETFEVPVKFTKSQEIAQFIVDTLNNCPESQKLKIWMNEIRKSWETITGGKMVTLETQILPIVWDAMKKQHDVRQAFPKISISPDLVKRYYTKKGADYVQIQGKGLYSFGDVDKLNLNVPDIMPNLKVSIQPEIMTSGGKRVLRATIIADLKKIKESSVDLDKEDGVQKFLKSLDSPPEFDIT